MSKSKSEAERLADRLGAAARQLTDALVTLMKQMEKMRADQLEKQAKMDKELGKLLKEQGFEASPDNIKIFKEHGEKLQAAEAKVADLDKQIEQTKAQEAQLREEMGDLGGEETSVITKINKLESDKAGKAPGSEDFKKIDAEIGELTKQREALGKQIDAKNEELDAIPSKLNKLEADKLEAGQELDGLMQGEDLKGLKVDSAKQSLRTFKENSIGEKLNNEGALSVKAKQGYGVEVDPAELANSIQAPAIAGPAL